MIRKKAGGPKVDAELRAKMDEVKAKLAADDTADLKVDFFSFDDGPSEHTGEILDLLKSTISRPPSLQTAERERLWRKPTSAL